jgi:diguanylate cyclase
MLASLLTTNILYVILVGLDHPARWALDLAAVLFGAVPLAIAVGARRNFTHVLRWMMVGLYCLLSVFLLAFQHRPGNGLTLAVNAVLFAVYFGCCIHVWYSYRGRGSAGSLISIVGFLGWAAVFVLGPFADAFAPGTSIDSEVWNLPKYVVAVGMILILLEDQIEAKNRLAFYDELTGLPNRRLFQDDLGATLDRACVADAQIALLVVDLDGFKQVNDSMGHDAGDQVLVEAATRFLKCVRRIDTVARTGGDEFCVILSSPTGREHAAKVAKSIEQAIEEQSMLGAKAIQIGASVGIAIFPEDARDSKSLTIVADSKMYETKRARKER